MKDGSTEDDNIVGNDKGRKTKEKKKKNKERKERGGGWRPYLFPMRHSRGGGKAP
jgi:hypothetical protein